MEDPQRYSDSSIYKQRATFSIRRLGDMIPARVVLYIMSFTGFLVSFMMRTDINITIVVMAKQSEDSVNVTYCLPPDRSANGSLIERKNMHGNEEFDWDSTIQSIILGSFYWCYILSQVVGGVLTQRFGTKAIFGGSQLTTAICSLLIPAAAEFHYGALIVLRSIQGIASGLTWPAMYAVVGLWIPPIERSRFMSSFQAIIVMLDSPDSRGILNLEPLNSMRTARVYFLAWQNQPGLVSHSHVCTPNGFSFGIGVTYPLCGFIIDHFGWKYVFYTTGGIGVFWCLSWYFLAYDAPASHPRISQQELQYIQGSLGNQVVGGFEGKPVPWSSILTSWPAWSIGITTFGRIWVHYVFIMLGPKYMKTVLGFDIQNNGLLNGIPFIFSYFSSVVFCYLADVLVKRRLMTLTNVRKTFTAISQVVPGLLILLIGYLGCEIVIVLIVWFIAVTLVTAAYAGAMANIVDIAPNLAGPVLAFAQTIHMSASFLSPIASSLLIRKDQSLEAWRRVFELASIVSCVPYIIYQIFGTADIQPWNYPDQKIPQRPDDDAEPLNESPHKNGIIVSIKKSDTIES